MKSLPNDRSLKAVDRAQALKQKAACSPRTALAISAWSWWTWIVESSRGFYRRIVERRAAEKRVCIEAPHRDAYD